MGQTAPYTQSENSLRRELRCAVANLFQLRHAAPLGVLSCGVMQGTNHSAVQLREESKTFE